MCVDWRKPAKRLAIIINHVLLKLNFLFLGGRAWLSQFIRMHIVMVIDEIPKGDLLLCKAHIYTNLSQP